MVFKPRKKRPAPNKGKANLIAQRERLAKPHLSKKEREELEQAFQQASQKYIANIHTGVQGAAKINPQYRSLIGGDQQETAKLFAEYVKSVSAAERKDFVDQVLAHSDTFLEDSFALFGLTLLLTDGETRPKSEPSSA